MPNPSHSRVAAGVLVLLLILAAIGSYTWYALPLSCGVEDVEKASTFLAGQRDRFDHSYQFATSASPDSIVRPVAELQQILMDTLEYEVPSCMETVKSELVHYMGAVVRAFLAYGAQEPESTIRSWLDQSGEHFGNFAGELEKVNKCAPFCLKLRP